MTALRSACFGVSGFTGCLRLHLSPTESEVSEFVHRRVPGAWNRVGAQSILTEQRAFEQTLFFSHTPLCLALCWAVLRIRSSSGEETAPAADGDDAAVLGSWGEGGGQGQGASWRRGRLSCKPEGEEGNSR